jgi:hypothetical protein
MPWELAEAELVMEMCRGFQALPEAGGVMDQPVWVLRMLAVLKAAEGDGGDGSVEAQHDPAAGLADFQRLTG